MRLLVVALLLVAAPAAAAPVLDEASDPYPGVHHERWIDAAIPARLHVVRVDLSSSELTLFATPEDERGRRTSGFAQGRGAQLAINGDAFAPDGYVPLGLAMGDAAAWASTADDEVAGFVRFARVGERTQAAIVAPEQVVAAGELPAGTQGVVSGRPLLVRAGQAVGGYDCADDVAIPCLRAPRTAVALSADGNSLWLVVVDGWQAGSLGMTATELAAFIDGLGADQALALDGGGAATLYLAGEGGVVSAPSDGAERLVANHLAIVWGDIPGVQLAGFIRERDIFDGPDLAGVLVTLDDGRTDTTAGDGLYNFGDVTPRLACVTAALAGYRTETRCKQLEADESVNYNSIALYPCSDFPAGCASPDAGPPPDAADPPVDGGALDDAGNPVGGDDDGGGGGGCGCRAAAAPGGGWLVLIVVIYYRRRHGSVSRMGVRGRPPAGSPAG